MLNLVCGDSLDKLGVIPKQVLGFISKHHKMRVNTINIDDLEALQKLFLITNTKYIGIRKNSRSLAVLYAKDEVLGKYVYYHKLSPTHMVVPALKSIYEELRGIAKDVFKSNTFELKSGVLYSSGGSNNSISLQNLRGIFKDLDFVNKYEVTIQALGDIPSISCTVGNFYYICGSLYLKGIVG